MADTKTEYEKVTCQHCEGAGCCFCNTNGVVEVRKPAQKCRHCEGVGCLYCGYTGWSNPRGKYE